MIRAVYQFMMEGDHEIAARETLNQFTGTHQVADANVHHAPGAVTVIIVDDPPPALSELLRLNGWQEHAIWRREGDGGEDEGQTRTAT